MSLMSVRSSVNSITGFTPYEITTGHQLPGPGAGTSVKEPSERLCYKPYYDQLMALVSVFSKQVDERQKGGPEDTGSESVQEWVLLKAIKRKWAEPRWTGPYKVVERTFHVLRLQGRGDIWYHHSQCTPADPP